MPADGVNEAEDDTHVLRAEQIPEGMPLRTLNYPTSAYLSPDGGISMHGLKLKEEPGRQELFRLASCPRMCSWESPVVFSSIPPVQRLTYLKSVTLTISEN